jgi:hypothetical protein
LVSLRVYGPVGWSGVVGVEVGVGGVPALPGCDPESPGDPGWLGLLPAGPKPEEEPDPKPDDEPWPCWPNGVWPVCPWLGVMPAPAAPVL